MTRRSNLAPLLLAGVLLVGAAVAGRFAMALIAHRYLSTALDLIQQHALKREAVDWVALRAQAHGRAVGARSPGQRPMTPFDWLASLGDHHSGLLEPAAVAALTQAGAGSPLPQGGILPSKIGLILVKSFVGIEQRAIDRHPDGVEPDQFTPPAPLDVIPTAAKEWLAGQPRCRLNRRVSWSEKQ
jgi:hypothetical protein